MCSKIVNLKFTEKMQQKDGEAEENKRVVSGLKYKRT